MISEWIHGIMQWLFGEDAASMLPGASPPPDPPSTSPKNVESHKWARPVIVTGFKRLNGREPTPYEAQYGHGVLWLESNYGKGWKGAMVGSNNMGAVQCAKGSTADCVPYEDSYADGTKYSVSFRRYATPEDGAEDALRHVFVKRPRTAAALASKGATVFRASFAMRRERYYEGFCPGATKAFGDVRPQTSLLALGRNLFVLAGFSAGSFGGAAVRASLSDPDRNDATRACQKEAVTAHAKRISLIIQDVAASCGDAGALPLGTYEDAERWYHSTFPDSGPVPSAAAPAAPAAPAAVRGDSALHRLIAAVRDSSIESPTWIDVPWGEDTLQVSADALRAKVDGALLRLPVTWAETMEICRLLDLAPLSAEVSDLIWQAATIKIVPRPLGKWDTPEEQKESSRLMSSLAWTVRFDKDLDKQIDGRSGLIADVGKDWILSKRLTLRPNLGVTYGWRWSNGKPIQGLGSDTGIPAHNDTHGDYSQKFRGLKRRTKEGKDVLDVYRQRGMNEATIRVFSQ